MPMSQQYSKRAAVLLLSLALGSTACLDTGDSEPAEADVDQQEHGLVAGLPDGDGQRPDNAETPAAGDPGASPKTMTCKTAVSKVNEKQQLVCAACGASADANVISTVANENDDLTNSVGHDCSSALKKLYAAMDTCAAMCSNVDDCTPPLDCS